jgi:hypothetical protein
MVVEIVDGVVVDVEGDVPGGLDVVGGGTADVDGGVAVIVVCRIVCPPLTYAVH